MGAPLVACLLLESLLGDAEGIHRRRHPSIEHHLGDDFRDFFFGYPNMQGAGNVPFNHLGAVAQHHQRRDGAEAAGFQVNGGPVVNLAIDYRVHQPHDFRREFGHCRRGLRVVLRPVVAHPEVGGGLFQVHHLFLVIILVVRLVLQVRTVGTQVRVTLVVKFGGHGNTLTLTLSQREGELWGLINPPLVGKGILVGYRICQ